MRVRRSRNASPHTTLGSWGRQSRPLWTLLLHAGSPEPKIEPEPNSNRNQRYCGTRRKSAVGDRSGEPFRSLRFGTLYWN